MTYFDALAYAEHLLGEVGTACSVTGLHDHPALGWRRAGLMGLTGYPGDKALVCPIALTSAADGALMALKALVDEPENLPRNGAVLLGERGRLFNFHRLGRVSANGGSRLLDTSDGRLALTLARSEDWDALPALLERDQCADWDAVTTALLSTKTNRIVGRGIELGLAVAADRRLPAPVRLFDPMPRAGTRHTGTPLVVDLSGLWAGPLAGSLLALAGAHVIKVESTTRPDAARHGNQSFYDLLNGGKSSVALNFSDARGVQSLDRLLNRAEIVIEASRPRALEQLGIDRSAIIDKGAVWVTITAHGAVGNAASRIGFGDDAGVAAGLSTIMAESWGRPMFVGDAIADPLTGIHAAFGAWAGWLSGRGQLIQLSLSNTIAYVIGKGASGLQELLPRWQSIAEADREPLYDSRVPRCAARPFGADTTQIVATYCAGGAG